ncbi:MAG: DUF5131 family protein, partial [Pirellulales bacterium]
MSEHSDIEWTDATWNPVRGCTKISPGCARTRRRCRGRRGCAATRVRARRGFP